MEQLPIEQKEQMPARNLKTHPEETIKAMAEVEGPAWFQIQIAAQEGKLNASERAISIQQALENLEKGKRTTIYGAGGKNRWFVAPDGKVSFVGMNACSEQHLEKARELGFEIAS
jgi:hypothetical protein